MGRKNSKTLMIILSILMIGLIISTAPATVAAGDWGNLEAGNEIKWKLVPDPVGHPDLKWHIAIEIVGISGVDMTYNYQITVIYDSKTSSWSGTDTDDDIIWGGVYSQSFLLKEKADAEADPDITWTETNFAWKGDNYKTYYIKEINGSDTYERWIDRGTGIILEGRWTTGKTTYTVIILESTTARLTKARFCLGTVLIAFVSAATLVSYSLVQYQKKRNT